MASESFATVTNLLSSIETEYEASRELNQEQIEKLFEELKKFENWQHAIKEFTWMFGLGEEQRHIVEKKECRKVYLVDFKACHKFLNNFISCQD
ncbi:CLUMA_CG017045, isoform A [Clunio marinus]|uniref:CLUMA_CG017045, isoform A n=1 Tax=Clunio marinus TaxID=568069 RepID=A0A1J1IWH9_9DIPT|nr:CLUMA_CG017045, isoform A [Clunio marinus]